MDGGALTMSWDHRESHMVSESQPSGTSSSRASESISGTFLISNSEK